jgi:hypothetical protein
VARVAVAEASARGRAAERAKTLKPDLARALRLARNEHAIEQHELHHRRQLVSDWENDDEPHAPTLLHLAACDERSRPVAVAALRWLAAKLGLLVTEAPAIDAVSEEVRAMRVLTECTDVPRALAERRADGRDDVLELERELRETHEALETLAKHAAYLVREIERAKGDA